MISIKEEKVIKDNKNGFPLKIMQDKSLLEITSNSGENFNHIFFNDLDQTFNCH